MTNNRNAGATRLFIGMAICFIGTFVLRRSLPSQKQVMIDPIPAELETLVAVEEQVNITHLQEITRQEAQRKNKPPSAITYFKHGKNDALLAERYCVFNANRESCCSEQHCAHVVRRSTLYSECCDNVHIDDNSTRANALSRVFPLLITSGPRSGTWFMHQLLTRAGLHGLTKETKSPHHLGMVSWKHVFHRESYFSGTKSATHLFQSKFQVIWHLVRDPLKSLTSIAFTEPLWEDSDHSRNYIGYISSHIPLTNKTTLMRRFQIGEHELEDVLHHRMINNNRNPKLERFLIYRGLEIYLYWHGFINNLNVPVFRLEDLAVDKNVTILDNVFKSIGREGPSHAKVLEILEAQDERRHNLNQRRRSLQEPQGPQNQTQSQTQQRRRLSFGRGDLKLTERGKRIRKGSRIHRETLTWGEICRVSRHKAKALLRMSQSFGYYMDIYRESLCT